MHDWIALFRSMRLAKSRTFGKLFPEVNIYGYMIYIYILWSLQMFSKDWNVPDKSPNITCRKTHVKIYRTRRWNTVFLDVPGCSESFRFMWIQLFFSFFFIWKYVTDVMVVYGGTILHTPGVDKWPVLSSSSNSIQLRTEPSWKDFQVVSTSFLCGYPVPLV